jgi:hypothetical protein
MNIETTSKRHFFSGNVQKMAALLVITPLLLAPTVASASGGTVAFHGQIVHSTCAVLQSSNPMPSRDFEYVKVSPQLTVMVETSHNICAEHHLPFVATFQKLPVPDLQASADGKAGAVQRSGILTMTYP